MPEPIEKGSLGLLLIGAIMTFITAPGAGREPYRALQEIAIARRHHAARFRDKALGLTPTRRRLPFDRAIMIVTTKSEIARNLPGCCGFT